jgi:non-heme chloroperoxidase
MKAYIKEEVGNRIICGGYRHREPVVFIPEFTFTTEVFSEQIKHFFKNSPDDCD